MMKMKINMKMMKMKMKMKMMKMKIIKMKMKMKMKMMKMKMKMKIEFPENSEVRIIESGSFSSSSLEKLSLPKSIENLEDGWTLFYTYL